MNQSSTTTATTTAQVSIEPFPRQLALLHTLATECLFGGASEGGKSVGIRIVTSIWAHLIPGLQVEIYRKFYKDVINNHMTGELNFKILLREWVEKKIVTITENQIRWVKTGSLITLGQLRTEEDAEKSQGNAKHVLVLDEGTQIKAQYIQAVRGWVRMSLDMKAKLPEQLKGLYPQYSAEQIKEMFPRIIYSANPIGTSVGYFRRNFVTPYPPGVIFRASDEEGGFLRQYLPSRIEDNPQADKEAQKRRLSGFGAKVANALITGDWTAPGGDYFPEWNEEKHVIADFRVPKHWFKFRVFDWGGAEPAYCSWWAVSDGEEFKDQDGRTRWLPRGALVCYREWNICNPDKPEEGLWMRNSDMAAGIVYRTPEATSGITLADSLPFQDRGMGEAKQVKKICDVFAENGVPLKKANTARIHGWSMMRDRLIGIPLGEGHTIPMFYVFASCQYLREYIPALTYHEINPEDAQEKGEATHSNDTARYACTALPPIQDNPKITKEGLRKEAEKNIMTFAGARKFAQKEKRKRGKR